ncbi:helix-turn-helix transcriptional regulator [Paenibacillus sp. ACRSA]|uniref:helix-turn-helix domain-containing protein n=1 Tax=Paenibacillus sp. ACRSA TaxID=2918211 RepID=UPI001EF6581B|nr:AraC family transcriptional regulator [Paenibacillus sp. ACRSA]MCG7379829.1 helix-turn-helix transcriptional regulator [Paenibacillus sp. ACRSA]
MDLLNHIYWKKKAEFALAEDIYDAWVVFAVEEGVFRYEIGGQTGEAGFADLVLCPPRVLFRRETVTPLTFHYIQFRSNSLEDENLLPPVGKSLINDTKRLASTYAYLRQATEDNDGDSVKWKTHLMMDLWQLYQWERRQNKLMQRKFTEDALMTEAAVLLEEWAGEGVSLRRLAEYLALSPVQLTRRFRDAFQETPSEYLKAIRLKKARDLLADSGLTLTQIAERCGYENGFYLSRVFSSTMGISPSEYRRRHQV